MSQIQALGENLKNLPTILTQYEEELEGIEQKLELKGQRLDHANRENPSYLFYYKSRSVELYTLVKFLDARVQSIRGDLFRRYTESHSRELSDRQKEKYIDNEPQYLARYEVYLEVKELYEKYQAVVEAFQARAYALNNITKARVADVHDAAI